jgi:eukaryotic-like serine/threonine-protein kinase
LLQPQQLFAGRYRVIRHLADGGMGAVYEAEHTATEARVALKLLWPHVVQVASARQRFELEARIAARVNDEHIVKVLDAGLDPESRAPFLVMELLAGRTLGALVQAEGPQPIATVLELMAQVASGLDAAHGYRGTDGTPHPIIHRDLKPENLFVTRLANGTLHIKILDFGIAKVLGDTTGVSQEVRGTPLYIWPTSRWQENPCRRRRTSGPSVSSPISSSLGSATGPRRAAPTRACRRSSRRS